MNTIIWYYYIIVIKEKDMGIVSDSKLIGKKFMVSFEKIFFEVEVVDVKYAYGSPLYLIKPLKGVGEQYVTLERLWKEIT
jgi:hypothetical protein